MDNLSKPLPALADVAVSLGVPVFACNGLKRPLMDGGFKVASDDPTTIRQMFDDRNALMIGMPTGSRSGLVVVDVDIKNGAKGDEWLQQHAGQLPPTRTHKTRSGGLHLLFRAPAGIEVRNSASRVAPGVDVRGEGGYVVVPPSPGYSVADHTEAAEMPAWLVELCLKPRVVEPPREPERPRRHDDSIHGSRYGLAALERECDAVAGASPGVQEPALNDGALRMGSLVAAGVLEARYAHDRLVDAGMRMSTGDASWPWSRAEVSEKVERGLTDGARTPRAIKERERSPSPRLAAAAPAAERFAPLADEPARAEAPIPQRSTFPLIRFEDIQPVPDAKDFVQGTLTEGSAAVVYGESNAGKTFWTTDLALHVAAGLEWNGRRVEAGPVLYVALEGGTGFRNRVAAWRTEKGMEDCSIPFFALCCPVNLLDPEADMPRFMETLRAVTDECGPPKLVVIDTLSRALSGGDENSSEDMGALVRNMDAIRFEIGCCVLFIHHSGKDASRGARGHSLLRAAVDTEIEVKAEEGSPLKTASTVKQRELAKGHTFNFTLRVVEIGQNRHGEAVTTCVIDDAADSPDTTGHRSSAKLSGDARRAFEVLQDLLAERGATGFQGTPADTVSVPDEWWRDRFYSRGKPGVEQAAKQKAFVRASGALTNARFIAGNNGRVWIV